MNLSAWGLTQVLWQRGKRQVSRLEQGSGDVAFAGIAHDEHHGFARMPGGRQFGCMKIGA